MSREKKKVDIERNYSDETFYIDSSENIHSKCKNAATLLQKRRQLRPINGSGNPYKSITRLTTFTSPSKSNTSIITQKIMSAKLLRMKQLQNELTDAQIQLNELSTENRILRTLQKRQDMALKKYESTQAELPQLIRSHNEEVRALKMKLKQVKTQSRELENHLKMKESELSTLQEQHKHLLKLSKDKHLGEREHLQQQVEHMQDLLKEQDKKVQMLSRKLMLETKNYKHHLSAEVTRHKRTTKELDIALDRITQLETILEAKEKYIAVNLRRSPGNQPSTLMSLVPQSKLQLYQTPSQSATTRNISFKQICYADFKKHTRTEENSKRECIAPTQVNKNMKHLEPHEVSHKHCLHKHKCQIGSNEEEDEVEDDDTDDDYQQPLLSESVETQSYASQNTINRTTENICKDLKGPSAERETKLDLLSSCSRSHREFAQMPNADETLQIGTNTSKKRNPLRRYSISGDCELVTSLCNTKSSRRGSLNGVGGIGKNETVFMSSLVSETDKKTNVQQNVLEKCSTYNLGNAESVHHGVMKSTTSTTSNLNSAEKAIFPSNEFTTTKFTSKNACDEGTGVFVLLPDMTAEGQLQLTAINSTWNEVQNRIRDETIRAQVLIEKYDEEQKNVDQQINSQTSNPESYDKSHLLAALRAIEDGADPVNLNEDVKEQRSQLSINKSKKGRYGKTVENLHRGIPIHSSSSVSSNEQTQSEHSFWESDTIMPSQFSNNDTERPRKKSDMIQSFFGNEKL